MPSSGDATGTSGGSDERPATEGGIEWTSHPARARPAAAALTAGFVALFVTLVHLGFRDTVMTVFTGVVFAVTLSPFYLPTRYSIGQDAVTVRTPFGTREKRLALYRRVQADRHGMLLSPFDRPSRLDRFHGLNLRFDAADRDRVLSYVRKLIGQHDGQG